MPDHMTAMDWIDSTLNKIKEDGLTPTLICASSDVTVTPDVRPPLPPGMSTYTLSPYGGPLDRCRGLPLVIVKDDEIGVCIVAIDQSGAFFYQRFSPT